MKLNHNHASKPKHRPSTEPDRAIKPLALAQPF